MVDFPLPVLPINTVFSCFGSEIIFRNIFFCTRIAETYIFKLNFSTFALHRSFLLFRVTNDFPYLVLSLIRPAATRSSWPHDRHHRYHHKCHNYLHCILDKCHHISNHQHTIVNLMRTNPYH